MVLRRQGFGVFHDGAGGVLRGYYIRDEWQRGILMQGLLWYDLNSDRTLEMEALGSPSLPTGNKNVVSTKGGPTSTKPIRGVWG